MSRKQIVSLILSCVFYALTIVGFFFFSVTLIIIVFLCFSLSITNFAYQCYQAHNDYTGAEHLQQEIGILNAEKNKLEMDYETLIKAKDKELEKRQESIEELTENLEKTKKELSETAARTSELSEQVKSSENEYESLLPPDDDDDKATIDIIEVAKKAISELADEAKKAGLRINISSASDRLMVNASAKRILIMFRNIIDNSIKYMQREGTLVITISAIEDDIFIVLKDTGKGLPENETKHIFELNFQGSNRISGNGLGLTQAKAIVEHYGGTIYARSPQGNGMGIYIQLPTT
ncbi:sensor histidine kinase [Butyrivibrio sp. FCS014]|uniref:sensor histidine kinase n=1 Tax=Butyrivibrio sp. FCS014 TaxID=1408304 RepID=UPI0004B1BE8C|nr:HAMP domain-containing sensor histidine kinase [Butyrivibrio sp. FCS014]